jgi:hypothetical protein
MGPAVGSSTSLHWHGAISSYGIYGAGVPLRFPNPGSDIARMVNSYQLIHLAARDSGTAVFDLDFMTKVLTEGFQASSRGAVGSVARARSADVDRSRDPLYNQLKMYSEVYRMLGWLRPAGRRLEFSTTVLGALVAEDFTDRPDLVYGLFRQCLMAITFPNPATNNVGVVNQRPFRWLLMLTAALDGVITRHEMIVGLLAVVDDLADAALDDAVRGIRDMRGGDRAKLNDAVTAYALSANVQINTLENYTRFPVGVLKSSHIGWGTSASRDDLYDAPISSLVLHPLGRNDAEWLRGAIDVREGWLQGYDLDQRAYFANYGHYAMLIRLGFDVWDDLRVAEAGCHEILSALGVSDPYQLLYSPVQQADDAVLARATNLD